MSSDKLRRGGAELAIIVVGVLIALGVDSWWAGQLDRASEGDYLAALYVDFLSDSLEYAGVAETLRRAYASSGAAIEIMDGQRTFSDPHEGIRTLFCASFLPLPVVSRATVDDLLSTGNLSLLEDRGLRTLILTYHSKVANESQWNAEYRANQARYREHLARARFSETTGGGFASVGADDYAAVVTALRSQPNIVAALDGMLFAQQRAGDVSTRLSQEAGLVLATLRTILGRSTSALADVAAAPSAGMPVDVTCPSWTGP